MAYELVIVLVSGYVCFAAFVILYAASKGYFRHRRMKVSSAEPTEVVPTRTPTVEPVLEVPTEVAPTEVKAVGTASFTAEPTPTFMPALYETVQPTPAPAHVSYPTASVASSGTTIGVKPTWTYRRRPAPNRSLSASKAPHNKSKKR